MGQKNQLEEILAAIRRKKKVYIKNLELDGISEEMKNNLLKDIELMTEEEKRILDQMDLDL